MDFSSLTETQQPQEQQQSYYSPQAQAYEAYYGHHHQHYDPSASHHQYYYPYEYATTCQQQQHLPAAPQDLSSTPAIQSGPSQTAQHEGAGAPGVPGYAQDNQGSHSVPPGLNPAAAAAVAALSQLSQFAGSMDAAERAMAGIQEGQWHGKGALGTMGQMVAPPHHPHQHPTQHRGVRLGAGVRAPYEVGSRRGGGPFRGGRNGGRANLGHYLQGPDGGAPPPFRGRGRGVHMGRGGGRLFHQSAKTSAAEPESAGTHVSGPPRQSHQPRQPRLPVAWCDICRVDCNSLDILEQHKNGKRHKRTVQRFQEIQAQQKLLAETQAQLTVQGFDEMTSQPQLMAESQEGVIQHPATVVQTAEENMIVQVGEDIKTSTVSENSQEMYACENTMKSELQGQDVDEQKMNAETNQVVDERVSEETGGIIFLPPAEGPTTRRPPKRRLMRPGRGGKRFRYFRPTESRPKVRPKPTESRSKERPKEQPRICTLCNVMCESKVVFDSHIAGKKHISRIKRFQGKAVYGPLNVYVPPNQPSMHNPPGLQPLFFGLKTQEMVNLVAQEPCSMIETYGPHRPEQGEPAVSVLQMEQAGGARSGDGLGTKDQAVVAMEGKCQTAVAAFEMEDAPSAQSVQPGSTVMGAESVFTSVKDVAVSETSLTNVEDVHAGPSSTATEPTVTTTEHVDARGEVAVRTAGYVEVEAEAAHRLIEHVAAEAEMASEIEDAVEAETPFESKGDCCVGS